MEVIRDFTDTPDDPDQLHTHGSSRSIVFLRADYTNVVQAPQIFAVFLGIGGSQRNLDRQGVVTDASTAQADREATVRAALETDGPPTPERQLSFAHELAKIAAGELTPPFD